MNAQGNDPRVEVRGTALPSLSIFTYGTLMRGQPNHKRFCLGATSIQEASTLGKLHRLPSGLLMLEVPRENILAVGTGDHARDLLTQEETRWGTEGGSDSPHTGLKNTQPESFVIHGELMTFPDGAYCLRQLDPFEGFHPGGHSFYRRLLVPVWTEQGGTSAWVYGR